MFANSVVKLKIYGFAWFVHIYSDSAIQFVLGFAMGTLSSFDQ